MLYRNTSTSKLYLSTVFDLRYLITFLPYYCRAELCYIYGVLQVNCRMHIVFTLTFLITCSWFLEHYGTLLSSIY